MILGIGVDLVRIVRLRQTLERFGERFLLRVFTPVERQWCADRPDPVACLAKRFAAKEALAKALGTGLREGIRFGQMEVVNDARGRPTMRFYGETQQWMSRLGPVGLHLSLSDEREYAVAFVVLEKEEEYGTRIEQGDGQSTPGGG